MFKTSLTESSQGGLWTGPIIFQNQVINGTSGNDWLYGGAGHDTINGGAGDDILDAGMGTDVLTGGAGQDVFLFDNKWGVDRITDFDVSSDKIGLENSMLAFSGLPKGTLSADAFRIGAGAADANDRIIYNETTGVISFDVDGNGSAQAVAFAQLAPSLALTHQNFVAYTTWY